MLEHIINNTLKYIEKQSKTERKKIGQFFTSKETAEYMASLFDITNFGNKSSISILDPGAGSGILTAALIERLESECVINKVYITCYENNLDIINILVENLEFIKNKSKIEIDYTIFRDNYLISQGLAFEAGTPFKKYDLVIGNPPYLKISKNSPEAVSMPSVCYGAPNLYFLFASMSLFNLKTNGQMVYIMPRSWTSGAYFKKFRDYFLSNGKLRNIHLFTSRDKVFDNETVLQETIIIRVEKTNTDYPFISITTSKDSTEFDTIQNIEVPYKTAVSGDEKYVYLVTDNEELEVLSKIDKFDCTLLDLNLKMKTGITVDFRNRELLRKESGDGIIPLFYSQHIKEGLVQFPIGKDYEYVVDGKPGLIQENKNYLFVKRFTSKEEKRRLQCGIYLSKNFPEYSHISTQNKLNFIDSVNNLIIDESLVFGLYVVFNSTIYDRYYRILNGSTQVNSTEINNIPMPKINILKYLGEKLKLSNIFSVEMCDIILGEVMK
ncbi:adenine-specific DNA-methyltransferase [Enterococcus sp. AZ135]|uniref:Eco57I restriction-modification methylase domain-containing protein n=1 Tax=unclassified Enterococcus TaxID=2608891 RepID=UPI003F210133